MVTGTPDGETTPREGLCVINGREPVEADGQDEARDGRAGI